MSKSAWDDPRFESRLSHVTLPPELTGVDNDRKLLKAVAPLPFELSTLAAALALKCSPLSINQYLRSYARHNVVKSLKSFVADKHPVIFNAAERYCVETVRLLLSYEVDPNVEDAHGTPVLNFAIIRSRWTILNPLEVVKALLGNGADPHTIPHDMWIQYIEQPAAEPPPGSKDAGTVVSRTRENRRILAETLHLNIRYYLHNASLLYLNKKCAMQLAKTSGFVPLLEVPSLVVSQTYAMQLIVSTISAHIGMNIKSPLVFSFAGHSGHGKTEVGKWMGQLLGLNMTIIDCSHVQHTSELLGASLGYKDSEKPSQLNKFLVENNGKRSVVFLYEFDKTAEEVLDALLVPLDSGDYHSRVTNEYIDCSKMVWILATNLGDQVITRFHENNMVDQDEEGKAKVPHKLLVKQLRDVYRERFGAPIVGRIKKIAPFYPFDPNEQAVITHKFLLDLTDKFRKPIDVSPEVSRLIGHTHLAIKNDGELCSHIAKNEYHTRLGALAQSCRRYDPMRLLHSVCCHG